MVWTLTPRPTDQHQRQEKSHPYVPERAAAEQRTLPRSSAPPLATPIRVPSPSAIGGETSLPRFESPTIRTPACTSRDIPGLAVLHVGCFVILRAPGWLGHYPSMLAMRRPPRRAAGRATHRGGGAHLPARRPAGCIERNGQASTAARGERCDMAASSAAAPTSARGRRYGGRYGGRWYADGVGPGHRARRRPAQSAASSAGPEHRVAGACSSLRRRRCPPTGTAAGAGLSSASSAPGGVQAESSRRRVVRRSAHRGCGAHLGPQLAVQSRGRSTQRRSTRPTAASVAAVLPRRAAWRTAHCEG